MKKSKVREWLEDYSKAWEKEYHSADQFYEIEKKRPVFRIEKRLIANVAGGPYEIIGKNSELFLWLSPEQLRSSDAIEFAHWILDQFEVLDGQR